METQRGEVRLVETPLRRGIREAPSSGLMRQGGKEKNMYKIVTRNAVVMRGTWDEILACLSKLGDGNLTIREILERGELCM